MLIFLSRCLFGIRALLILYEIRSYVMCIVMFPLYLHLDSHSFYLLFMFLLLHILFWCQAPAYWNDICSYSANFFPLHLFPPLGPAKKKISIYRHSLNHLTFLPHLLKHGCYYPLCSVFCFYFKIGLVRACLRHQKTIISLMFCSRWFFFFPETLFTKTWTPSILSAAKAAVKLSLMWFQHRDYQTSLWETLTIIIMGQNL